MDSGDIRILDVPLPDGLTVRTDAYLPGAGQAQGIVVVCHGFMGHRRWGFLPELCLRLRNAGLAALSMDFTHNGYIYNAGEGPYHENGRFDPGIFRRNTISRECSDLGGMVRYISRTRLGGRIPHGAPIGLYGHSRGALSVILHALEREDCRAICTWATTSNPNFYTDHQKEVWRRNGCYEFTNPKSGLPLALDISYLEDLETNRERFRLLERVCRLKVPHLLVHGTMDLAVPPACSEKIFTAETDLKDKHLILLKTGHTFGFANNTSEFSQAFEIACRETVKWFHKYLAAGG